MKLQTIIDQLEAFAPLALQEDFDNCGLLIGKRNAEITGILLCIDVSEAVIDEACENRCNLIISHHPLIFHGLKSLTESGEVERCVAKAIKNDVAIYASHTCMDSAQGGVSHKMAEKLSLGNVQVLVPQQDETVGLGVVGELPHEMEEKTFLELLKQTFHCDCIKHSPLLEKNIRRVALCGGSGADFIAQAKNAKADIYVTADVTYHRFFEAENQLIIADIGHFESEQFTKEIFLEQLSKNFPNFAIRIAESEPKRVFVC